MQWISCIRWIFQEILQAKMPVGLRTTMHRKYFSYFQTRIRFLVLWLFYNFFLHCILFFLNLYYFVYTFLKIFAEFSLNCRKIDWGKKKETFYLKKEKNFLLKDSLLKFFIKKKDILILLIIKCVEKHWKCSKDATSAIYSLKIMKTIK